MTGRALPFIHTMANLCRSILAGNLHTWSPNNATEKEVQENEEVSEEGAQ